MPTPEAIAQLVKDGGAVAVFIIVFVAAITGYLRFRPGVEGETRALRDANAELVKDRDYWREHATQLAHAVDKLGDAVDYGNRRLRDDRGT